MGDGMGAFFLGRGSGKIAAAEDFPRGGRHSRPFFGVAQRAFEISAVVPIKERNE
jgi:hypothetical protein